MKSIKSKVTSKSFNYLHPHSVSSHGDPCEMAYIDDHRVYTHYTHIGMAHTHKWTCNSFILSVNPIKLFLLRGTWLYHMPGM